MSVEQVMGAVERYRTARPAMRRPHRDSAAALAQGLRGERDELVLRLEKRWAWLDAHPGHPQHGEREDAVLADLREYERMEDALREAAAVLYGGSAA